MDRQRTQIVKSRDVTRGLTSRTSVRWLGMVVRLFLLGCVVQVSWAASNLDQRLKEEQQELRQLKGQLKSYQNRLERTKQRERTVVQELEQTNRQLQQKGRELQTYERQLTAQIDKHTTLLKEREVQTQQLQTREGLLHVRLRALYKQGGVAYLPFWLSASDVSDFFERVHFTSKLVQHDAQVLQQYRSSLEALEQTQRAVKAREEQLAKAKVRVAAKTEEMEKERLKKDTLLTKIREEQGSYASAMREIEEASARLVGLIAELERQRKREVERQRVLERQAREQQQRQARAQPPPSTPSRAPAPDAEVQSGFTRLRGKLGWPIDGPLISTYGKAKHPMFNTYTFNKGIGIGAPLGSDFCSIETGEVLYADWFKGYGNLLIVGHGDNYYSLYAYAAEIMVQVGEKVKRAQVVGKVGESGSFNRPALYFEIRHHGKPENPLEWLANHRP